MEEFLRSIDPGLVQYSTELMQYAVTNENTLRFLRPAEVNCMQIPNVYKRMLIDKIVSLQTPDTKRKLKDETFNIVDEKQHAQKLPPKRLKYDEEQRVSAPSTTSNKPLTTMQQEMEKLREERDCLRSIISQKKEELDTLKSAPVSPKALPIPGLPVINVVCDNCHHRGHRVCGNRGGQKCPYVKCSGYHYCGLEGKHKEYRQEVSEAEKEVQSLEKKCKDIDAEIAGMSNFIKQNNSSFIATVRPKLLVSNALRYKGKDGNNHLQRDIRLIKIATGGKIPTVESKESFCQLIEKGKAKLVENGIDCDLQENTAENTQSDLEKCVGKQNFESNSSKNYSVTGSGFNTPMPNQNYQMYMQGMCGYTNYTNYPYGTVFSPYGPTSLPGYPNSPYFNNPTVSGALLPSSVSQNSATTRKYTETFSPPLPKENPPENPPLPPSPPE